MKAQVNIMLDTAIIGLVEQKSHELGISRMDAFRTAIAAWVGVRHDAKPVLPEKHYAYLNGVSLGVFPTKEEAQAAKRAANAVTKYLQVFKTGHQDIALVAHFGDKLTEMDDPYHEYFIVKVTVHSQHSRRFAEWETLANTISAFRESERGLVEVLTAAEDLANEHSVKGCVVEVVVA